MDIDVIISTGASLVATIVSAVLAYVTTRDAAKIMALRDRVSRLSSRYKEALEQVEAYHVEETLLVEELVTLRKGSTKTLKTRFRDMVMAKGFIRPHLTALEARQAITDLQGAGRD